MLSVQNTGAWGKRDVAAVPVTCIDYEKVCIFGGPRTVLLEHPQVSFSVTAGEIVLCNLTITNPTSACILDLPKRDLVGEPRSSRT